MRHKLIQFIRLRNIGLIIVGWLRRMPAEGYLLRIAQYTKAGISVILIATFTFQGLALLRSFCDSGKFCYEGQAWGHTKGEGAPTGVGSDPTPLSPGQRLRVFGEGGVLRPRAALLRNIKPGSEKIGYAGQAGEGGKAVSSGNAPKTPNTSANKAGYSEAIIKIMELMLKINDHDFIWLDHRDKLQDYLPRGPIGKRTFRGRIIFDPSPGFRFYWPVLGTEKEDGEVIILGSGIAQNGFFRFYVAIRSGDSLVKYDWFQIGPYLKELTKRNARGETKTLLVFDILRSDEVIERAGMEDYSTKGHSKDARHIRHYSQGRMSKGSNRDVNPGPAVRNSRGVFKTEPGPVPEPDSDPSLLSAVLRPLAINEGKSRTIGGVASGGKGQPMVLDKEQLPISARRISWTRALEIKRQIRAIIEAHEGRAAFYVHIGGRYITDGKGRERYLRNIKEALQNETGVAFVLGGDYSELDDIKTKAIIIDIPSVSPRYPVPSVGVRVALSRIESWHMAWRSLVGAMRQMGVKNISPFGGEQANFDKGGLLYTGYQDNIGCVGGALYFLRDEFPVEIFPQLCGCPVDNHHLIGQHSLSEGSYQAISARQTDAAEPARQREAAALKKAWEIILRERGIWEGLMKLWPSRYGALTFEMALHRFMWENQLNHLAGVAIAVLRNDIRHDVANLAVIKSCGLEKEALDMFVAQKSLEYERKLDMWKQVISNHQLGDRVGSVVRIMEKLEHGEIADSGIKTKDGHDIVDLAWRETLFCRGMLGPAAPARYGPQAKKFLNDQIQKKYGPACSLGEHVGFSAWFHRLKSDVAAQAVMLLERTELGPSIKGKDYRTKRNARWEFVVRHGYEPRINDMGRLMAAYENCAPNISISQKHNNISESEI